MPGRPASPLIREVIQPALAGAIGVAALVWTAWFVLHLPWLMIPEQTAKPALILIWLAGLIVASVGALHHRRIQVGVACGLFSALLGLAVFLSMNSPQSGADTGVVPAVALLIPGFLVLGMVLGLFAGVIAKSLGWPVPPGAEPDWFKRAAILTVIAASPLLFVGGLVTSTNSGMAVPDWPGTFGSNMFLYPLGPTVPAPIYFEHSHRLFGTLTGITTILVFVWSLLSDRGGRVKVWAGMVLVLVIAQGVLGGVRVRMGDADPTRDLRFFAVIHGVLAQIVFAMMTTLCVYLSCGYREIQTFAGARKLRVFGTAALHLTLVQLVLGAVYRHLRHEHSLWAHAGFATLVIVAALIAGFMCVGVSARAGSAGRLLRAWGVVLLIAVAVQYLLGWVAFMGGGRSLEAATQAQAIIRTLHQANGALMLATVTAAAVLSRRASPLGVAVAE